MIPLRIEVTNLGAIPHANIDLSNISLAGVVGPNGTGKSTLLTIAPLFALFGATKNGVSVDDMVRTGQQEMAVTFKFEHRGERYLVNRTRSKKGRGKSACELQHLVGNQWISESGTTIKETDEKIRALLNLDEETFTASSMILQGKANEFTAKPSGQRKAILQQILGLEIYDRLQEQAKAKERAVSVELEATKQKLADLDQKLKAREGTAAELADVDAELAIVAVDIETKEAELKMAEEVVRNLESMIKKAEELLGQIEVLDGEIAKKQGEKQEHQGRLDRANAILATEARINEKAAEYEQVKQQVALLQSKRPRLIELGNEENRLAGEIERMGKQLLRLAPQIREVEHVLESRGELEKAAAEYRETAGALDRMDRLADQWNELNTKAQAVERQVADWDKGRESDLGKYEVMLKEWRQQSAVLNRVPCSGSGPAESCPLIKSAISARDGIPKLEEKIRQASETKNPHIDEWQILIRERDTLKYDQVEHKRLKTRVVELRPKAEQAAQLEVKAQLLETLRGQKKQLEEQRTGYEDQLKKVRDDANTLAAKLEPLASMEQRLPKLAEWVRAKEELPAARQLVATATEAIVKLNGEISDMEEQKKGLELERFALNNEAAQLGTAKAMANLCSGVVKVLQQKQNNLYGKAGGLKTQIDALNRYDEERQLLAAEMEPKARELTRWQTLIKAFGRDGIPALIIENAIPELERISNEILGQMSNGKHSVRFETQRELKSTKGAMAETLDIIVGDWAGDRPYETFSGGEQLRIDFAIRFALAELLARRAGSKIEWLVVDEGLGSQDREHRTLVLESIKAVADRFRKTLVITHIEEAQAAFEQIICLEPQEAGLTVKVA